MARRTKLTDDMRLLILERRLLGATGRAIANDMPITHSIVYDFLSSLPGESTEGGVLRPDISDEDCLEIFSRFVNGENTIDIAREMSLERERVIQLFQFLKQRKRGTQTTYRLYPKVAMWLSLNGFSVTCLAKNLDVPKVTLIRALGGVCHMKLEMAEKIREFTGLSLSDIFEEAASNTCEDDPPGLSVPPAKRQRRRASPHWYSQHSNGESHLLSGEIARPPAKRSAGKINERTKSDKEEVAVR